MNQLRFEQRIADFHVDALLNNRAFDVLIDLRDARRLRTTLMEMAQVVSATDYRVVLVLEEPHITELRLIKEWEGAMAVFRRELIDRISIAIHQNGKWKGFPAAPKNTELAVLDEVIQHTLSTLPSRLGRVSESYYEILRILIHYWLLDEGPLTISSLMEISGFSHPTVAKALSRLEHYLRRHSDRSVELRYFPRQEWARLVAVSADVRGTIHFVDRSGHARSPESLLKRLRALGRDDIAVGGVWGAKNYYPSLDLIGNARLDLSVHSPKKAIDLSFVQRLDPALVESIRRDELPTLAVHTIRRAVPLFHSGKNDVSWADPVECLLDLHETHLEAQAKELLQSFVAMKGGTK